ncbi:hypothetical protein DQ238_11410, partial [Geodermatophilus sp. TF02-6]|uniref:PIN domain-containing protein n=1 Tax=Geodermatophilus sp. TF02-6 TaxID=2250575 RepID=UPI000E02AA4D
HRVCLLKDCERSPEDHAVAAFTFEGSSVIREPAVHHLGGRDCTSESEQVRRLLGAMTEYSIDRQTADEAGRIRREAGIRLPDALIAATALIHSLTLDTRNLSDFRRVSGLRLRRQR